MKFFCLTLHIFNKLIIYKMSIVDTQIHKPNCQNDNCSCQLDAANALDNLTKILAFHRRQNPGVTLTFKTCDVPMDSDVEFNKTVLDAILNDEPSFANDLKLAVSKICKCRNIQRSELFSYLLCNFYGTFINYNREILKNKDTSHMTAFYPMYTIALFEHLMDLFSENVVNLRKNTTYINICQHIFDYEEYVFDFEKFLEYYLRKISFTSNSFEELCSKTVKYRSIVEKFNPDLTIKNNQKQKLTKNSTISASKVRDELNTNANSNKFAGTNSKKFTGVNSNKFAGTNSNKLVGKNSNKFAGTNSDKFAGANSKKSASTNNTKQIWKNNNKISVPTKTDSNDNSNPIVLNLNHDSRNVTVTIDGVVTTIDVVKNDEGKISININF